MTAARLTVKQLADYGLSAFAGANVDGMLAYERPAIIQLPSRIKDCTLGAFTYLNTRGTSSFYRCRIGRYAQFGEQVIAGAPDHPVDWFSSHPFAFTQPAHMPHLYRLPEFARLAPEDDRLSQRYLAGVPTETVIGHDVYVGSGAYIRRGVTIGDGAVIGARSVVLDDVPPFAIVAGSPARLIRYRFADAIVDRMLRLAWWHYDLAPYKHAVDFSKVEETLAFFEARQAEDALVPLTPETFRIWRDTTGFVINPQATPLYAAPVRLQAAGSA